MEKKLKHLFDYQNFQKNPRMMAMIADAEGRYGTALSDDDLSCVNAAGEPETPVIPPRLPVGLIIPEGPDDED